MQMSDLTPIYVPTLIRELPKQAWRLNKKGQGYFTP